MKRVALIIGEHDPWDTRPYMLKHFLGPWRDMGIEVVINRGPRRRADADAAFLHVDLTHVPRVYLDLAATYPRRFNACRTISRRLLPLGRARPGDGHGGPVIVKTARNFFGIPDRETARASGGLARAFARAGDRLAKRLPWWVTGRLDGAYRILDDRRAVPPTAWRDPRFVIQRYVEDREGGFFVARRWYALGDAGASNLVFARTRLVKGLDIVRRAWTDDPPPPEVIATQRAFNLEYCKIDYGVDRDGVVIFDVNKTIGLDNPSPEFTREMLARLAPGIRALVGA